MEAHEMKGLAVTLAQIHHLDVNYVLKLIEQESNWNPKAVNRQSRCSGLMQLNPRFYEGNLLDIRHNLETGMGALAQHLKASEGDWSEALARWNWGSGNVVDAKRRYGRLWMMHIPRETWYMIYKVLLDRDGR